MYHPPPRFAIRRMQLYKNIIVQAVHGEVIDENEDSIIELRVPLG
jgi:hypothetical protein